MCYKTYFSFYGVFGIICDKCSMQVEVLFVNQQIYFENQFIQRVSKWFPMKAAFFL